MGIVGAGNVSGDRQIKAAVSLLAIFGFIVLAVQAIVGGETNDLAYLGLGIALIAISTRIINNWRDGFFVFLVWLLFEDLVRKYLGNNMLIFFAKDFLAGLTYVSFVLAIRRGRVKTFRPPFLISMAIFFAFGVIQVFNPNSPSVFYGLLGLKLYFFYAPLMFVAYAFVDTEEKLRQFLVFNMILAGIIALLGIIQSIVGLSFLNPATLAPEIELLGRLTRVSPLTGVLVARPTSVFVSDGRFASYMVLMFIVGLGTAGYLILKSRPGRGIVLISLGLCAVGAVMSGSRGAFVFMLVSSLVVSAGALWGAPWRWHMGHRLVHAIRRSVMVIGFGLFLIIIIYPAAIGARWTFYLETMSPDSAAFELGNRAWDYPVQNLKAAFDQPNWMWGNGIGTASLGLQYVSSRLGLPMPRFGVESGYGTLIVEMGVVGLGLWILWTVHIMISVWGLARRAKQSIYFPIAMAVAWFSFVLLFIDTFASMVAYQNYTSNAYLWLLLGVLFRLPDYAARAAVSPAPANPGRVA